MTGPAAVPVIVAAMATGDFAGASRICREALATQGAPEIEHALSLCEHQLGEVEAGLTRLEVLLERCPRKIEWHVDLAGLLAARDRWADVHARLSPLVDQLDPRGMTLWLASAVATGCASEALRAIAADTPNRSWVADVSCIVELARVCFAGGDLAAAEDAARWCLAQAPEAHRAREVLALVLQRGRDRDLALPHWRALVQGQPERGRRHLELSVALAQLGFHEEARGARLEALRRSLSPADRSAALYLSLFDERETAATIRTTCETAFTNAPRRLSRRRRQAGPLHVGILSAEYERPPATFFIMPVLRNLDRQRCRVFLYNNSPTRSARPTCAHDGDVDRHIAGCSDDEVLASVEADGIDVLLDLSGHFPGNRLRMMARRAAPVQATFPNYPCTTGCANVDYFFTDVWNSPPGTDDQYSESLCRLPSGCLRFEAPPAPEVTPRPPEGPVTFGLFQRAIKYSDSLWDMVAGALQAVPDSRLLVHSSDLEWDVPNSGLVKRVRRLLGARGVAPERLAFAGGRDLQAHLHIVGSVDIALDSYPYGGQTTTMECLWMGVPVVSRRGDTHVSRVSGALLSRAGLDALVADDAPRYVAAAAALAVDREGLLRLRSTLRNRVIDSGLTDGQRLCREMEDAFEAWVESV